MKQKISMNRSLVVCIAIVYIKMVFLLALDYQIDTGESYRLDNRILHVQILSTGQIEIHDNNGVFSTYSNSLKLNRAYNISNSLIFGSLNYFNDSIVVGITQKNSQILVYNKDTDQIVNTIADQPVKLIAKIVYYTGSTGLLLSVDNLSVWEYNLNSTTHKQLFSLNNQVPNDTFIGFSTINNSQLILYSNFGNIYLLNFYVNTTTVEINATLTLLRTQTYSIKSILLILNLPTKYFIVIGNNKEMNIYRLSDCLQIPYDSLLDGKQLLQVQTVQNTTIYFIYTDSQIKVDLIHNQFVYIRTIQSGYILNDFSSMVKYIPGMVDIFYQIGSNKIYEWGKCLGNKQYIASQNTCKPYNCSTKSVCNSCPFSRNICNGCIPGYIIDNGNCVIYACNVGNCLNCETKNFCSECASGYILNFNGQCTSNSTRSKMNSTVEVKNDTAQIQNSSIPNTANFNTTKENDTSFNTTTNQTNQNQLNETTSPSNTQTTTNTSNQKFSMSKEFISNTYEYSEPYIKSLAQTSMTLNSIPILRGLMKFLIPFFAFFDDYWYYIYHNNHYYQLEYIPDFLVIMYKTNSARIVPDYVNLDSAINIYQISPYFPSCYDKYTNIQILRINEKQTYFLKNSQQMICFQYVLSIVLFVIVKIISAGLSIIQQKTKNKIGDQNSHLNQRQPQPKSSILSSVSHFLKRNTPWYKIPVLLIEANMIFIAYQVGLQFNLFFSFRFTDKINLIASTIFGFIAIVYAFDFYFITEKTISDEPNSQRKFQRRIGFFLFSKKITQNKNQTTKQSSVYAQKLDPSIQVFIRFQTYFVCIKCLLMGFTHSMLINHSYFQLGVLIFIKLILILLSIQSAKLFNFQRHIWTFLALTIYFLIGIGFDFLLIMSKMAESGLIFIQKSTTNLIEAMVIYGILLSVVFQLIISLWNLIHEIFIDQKSVKNQTIKEPQIKSSQKANQFIQNQQRQKVNFLFIGKSQKNVVPYSNLDSQIITPEPIIETTISDSNNTTGSNRFMFHKKIKDPSQQVSDSSIGMDKIKKIDKISFTHKPFKFKKTIQARQAIQTNFLQTSNFNQQVLE